MAVLDSDTPIGTPLNVTILKNGYWHDEKYGTFEGFTRTGRIRVRLHLYNKGWVKRAYHPDNVSLRK